MYCALDTKVPAISILVEIGYCSVDCINIGKFILIDYLPNLLTAAKQSKSRNSPNLNTIHT